MKKYVFLATFTLFCSYSLADTQIYRWVDNKGQTHYSDKAPSQAGAKADISYSDEVQPTIIPSDIEGKKEEKPTAGSGEKIQVETAESMVQREEIKRQNCKIAKANLKSLTSGGLVKSGVSGQYLTKKEIEAQIRLQKRTIETSCN